MLIRIRWLNPSAQDGAQTGLAKDTLRAKWSAKYAQNSEFKCGQNETWYIT